MHEKQDMAIGGTVAMHMFVHVGDNILICILGTVIGAIHSMTSN